MGQLIIDSYVLIHKDSRTTQCWPAFEGLYLRLFSTARVNIRYYPSPSSVSSLTGGYRNDEVVRVPTGNGFQYLKSKNSFHFFIL
jgi:hypothetical protein